MKNDIFISKEVEEKMQDVAFDGVCPFCSANMQLMFEEEKIYAPNYYNRKSGYYKYSNSTRVLFGCPICGAKSPSVPLNTSLIDTDTTMVAVKKEIALSLESYEDEEEVEEEEA